MSGLIGFGKGLGQGVWKAGKSTVQGLGDLAKGGWSLATDPAARARARETATELARRGGDYANQVRADPAKALRDARDGANRMYTEFDEARCAAAARGQSGEFWGNAVGQVGFEVGTMLVPVGALSKAGKLGKAAKAADGMGDAARAVSTGKRAKAVAAAAKEYPSLPLSCEGCIRKIEAMKSPAAKMKRPAPSTYLDEAYVKGHLADFNDGAVRIQSWDPSTSGIAPKDNNLFVLPKKDAEALIAKANGDPRALEKLLSIPDGSLGDNPFLVDITGAKNVRMPTGRELSANDEWLPGGYTKGGIREAVIDAIKPGDFKVSPAFPKKGP